jgi:glycosyltransferase involved in cell wall biosynthesis
MINVLAVEDGPGFGGALVSLKYLLEYQKNDTYRFYLLTNYPQDYILAKNAVNEIAVFNRKRIYGVNSILENSLRLFFKNKSGPIAYAIDYLTFCKYYVYNVKKYLKRWNIDIIHLNNWPLLNDGALFAAKQLNIPVVMHIRGFEYNSKLISWLTNKSDHVIAISDYIRDQILELGINENRITVIPNAVDVEEFSTKANGNQFKKLIGLPTDEIIVGMAGCLVSWKGHKFFIEACAEIFKNSSVHGMVIGGTPDGDPSFESNLRSYADKLGILDRIHFVGHQRDIASAMDACDILVHASTQPEPFGRVIIEAMALGKPVVATYPGGPSEIINNGKDGILIPPADSKAMASAINKLISDVEYRFKIGWLAKKKVTEKYDVRSYTEKIFSIYQKVLNN